MDNQHECDERSESTTICRDHICLQHTGAVIEAQYEGDQYIWFGVTCRPLEHKMCTLGSLRKKYANYTLDEQRQILMNIVKHFGMKEFYFKDIVFEYTKLQGKDLVHFHAFFKYDVGGNLFRFTTHCELVNTRYGVPTYTAFDIKLLKTYDDFVRWHEYIHKGIKHDITTWTAGI